MGNAIKLFGGIILSIIGLLLVYGTYTYNLIDIILILGIVLLLVGIILLLVTIIGIDKQNTDNMYNNTLNSLSNRRNTLQRETRSIIDLENRYNLEKNNESIFTNINKQFAERFNEKDTYTPPLRYNTSLSAYEGIEEINTEDKEKKKVLRINKNWDKPNENLKPIKTEHNKKPPASIYQETNQPYQFTENYKRPEKIIRKPKKREKNTVKQTPKENYKQNLKKPHVISNATNKKNAQPPKKPNNSYIICGERILNSKEAFDLIIKNTQTKVLLEVPNLKDLSVKFLTIISKLNTKLIIQKFNMKETSYILLLSALMERGVEVKILPTVNTKNIVTDDNKALIISKNDNALQYGAVYTDKESVKSIKEDFNNSWNIANSIEKEIKE